MLDIIAKDDMRKKHKNVNLLNIIFRKDRLIEFGHQHSQI